MHTVPSFVVDFITFLCFRSQFKLTSADCNSSVADLDILLLLTVQAACNKEGVKIPWEKVANMMGPNFTEGAIVQHLTKLRLRREADQKPVPPALRRSANSKPNKPNKKRKAEDDDSDLFVPQSDAENEEYGTPKKTPKKAKVTRFPAGTTGNRYARLIGKDKNLGDSDVQCAGASFLHFGYEQNADPHSSVPSASDIEGSDLNISDAEAVGSGKKKNTPRKSLIVRLPVKRSVLLGFKLREAMDEENRSSTGGKTNMYPLPPWRQPPRMGMTPGTSFATNPHVRFENMPHPGMYQQPTWQPSPVNPFAGTQMTGLPGLSGLPGMPPLPGTPNTPFQSSPVPSRPYRLNPFEMPESRMQTPGSRESQSQSQASQPEEPQQQFIDPKIFLEAMRIQSSVPRVEPSSDMPVSNDFVQSIKKDDDSDDENDLSSIDMYQFVNEDI
jgi:hypothetical protein